MSFIEADLDKIHGRFEFSEGASAKWIFDVEIVKLKTQILCVCQKDQNYAWLMLNSLNSAFLVVNVARNFLISFFFFSGRIYAGHKNLCTSIK